MEAKRKMRVKKSQLKLLGLIMRKKNESETLSLTVHIKWKMERENNELPVNVACVNSWQNRNK